MRWAIMALAFVLAASVFVVPAEAAKAVCRQLAAELASAGASGGKAAARYDKAIQRQRSQLAVAQGQARGERCGALLFGGSVKRCAGLRNTIEKMQSNLESLEAKRARMGNGRSRGRVLAAIKANGCDGERTAGLRGTNDELRILSSRDGNGVTLQKERVRRIVNLGPGRIGIEPEIDRDAQAFCVRTCDGFFFPMTQATSTMGAAGDQKSCEASCPGTKIEVYYRAKGSQDAASMTSALTGVSYGELGTAFDFRDPAKPITAGCGCKASQSFASFGGGSTSSGDGVSQSGSFAIVGPKEPQIPASAAELAEVAEPVAEENADAAPAERRVRVVGPAFLPDPEGALDLTAPAPPPSP